MLLELHSKRNTLGTKVVQEIIEAVQRAEKDYSAMVIGTVSNDFSVGADLTEMMGAAATGNLQAFKAAISNFQNMTMTVKHSAVPVVAAIKGFTFGGGCELALHSDAIQAAPETYMGLVECGVGLLPAGGGCKEMALRASINAGPRGDLYPYLARAFETIGMAKVSSSSRDYK